MPGVRALRTYERSWLSRDLIAGIVLVTLLVPQGMAYAELAGLPAITGLYTTVVCLIAYALVGPSPILVLGPDSSLGPMIAATILPLAAGSQEMAIALAGMLALLVGLVTIGAGVAKLGFVADLLSNPVRTGYLAGLAVVIFIGQLPKLFGFSTDADGLVDEARAFVAGPRTRRTPGRSASACSAWPSSWASSGCRRGRPGILIAVVVAIVLSIVLDLAARGVDVIGVLPQGFPLPTFPAVPTEDIAAAARRRGRHLARRDRRHDLRRPAASRHAPATRWTATRSWPGIGSANLAAGLFSGLPGEHERLADRRGLPVRGEDPADRPHRGGARAGDAAVRPGPRPGDAAAGARGGRHRRVDQPVRRRRAAPALPRPQDRVRARRRLRPRRHVRRRPPGDRHRRRAVGHLHLQARLAARTRRSWAEPRACPAGTTSGATRTRSRSRGCSSCAGRRRSSSPTPTMFRDRIRELVQAAEPPPSWVLVAAEPITDIDTTAGAMLADLDLELNAAGIHLAFAELQSDVRDAIVRYGLLETIDQGHLYASVTEAVESIPAGGRRSRARGFRRGTRRFDGIDVVARGLSGATDPVPIEPLRAHPRHAGRMGQGRGQAPKSRTTLMSSGPRCSAAAMSAGGTRRVISRPSHARSALDSASAAL